MNALRSDIHSSRHSYILIVSYFAFSMPSLLGLDTKWPYFLLAVRPQSIQRLNCAFHRKYYHRVDSVLTKPMSDSFSRAVAIMVGVPRFRILPAYLNLPRK